MGIPDFRELERRAEEHTTVFPDAPLERYIKAAAQVRDKGYEAYEHADYEAAYVLLLRFVNFVMRFASHPDWNRPDKAHRKRLFKDQAESAFSVLADVKKELRALSDTDAAVRRRQLEREAVARAAEEEQRRVVTARLRAAQELQRQRDLEEHKHRQAAPQPGPVGGTTLSPAQILAVLAQGDQPAQGPRYPAVHNAVSAAGATPPRPGNATALPYGQFLPPPPAQAGVALPSALRSAAATMPPPPVQHAAARSAQGQAAPAEPLISTASEAPADISADGGAGPSAAEELQAALEGPGPDLSANAHGGAAPGGGAGVDMSQPGASGAGTAAEDASRPISGSAGHGDGGGGAAATMGAVGVERGSGGLVGPVDAARIDGVEEAAETETATELARSSETEGQEGTTPEATPSAAQAPPNAEHPHTSYTLERVPHGPAGKTAQDMRNRHMVGAPPPPKLSSRPAPTTGDQRTRLRHHLALRGFREHPVPGDGNCQFHALVDQLSQNGVTDVDARSLRIRAVQWLQENAEREMDDGSDGGDVPTLKESIGVADWPRYLKDMRRHGVTWGDEGTLLAVSTLYRAEIVIISSISEEYCHIVHPPPAWKVPLRMRLYLGHYHEFHYVSVRFA